jgi:ankyrin repeat protein
MTALLKSDECITILIDAGVNVNAVDTIALQSVLMRAVVMHKDIRIINALIDAGADINYICPLNGYSVLMCACTTHHISMACICALVNAGANCYDRFRDGTTVMDKILSL